MRGALIALDRLCPHCGGPGPYYASQSPTASWCVACLRAATARRYAARRATINATVRARRLAKILAVPPSRRTRNQRALIVRATEPSGRRTCTWCWELKPLRDFRELTRGGTRRHDSYCHACRLVYNRLYHRRVAQQRGRRRQGAVP